LLPDRISKDLSYIHTCCGNAVNSNYWERCHTGDQIGRNLAIWEKINTLSKDYIYADTIFVKSSIYKNIFFEKIAVVVNTGSLGTFSKILKHKLLSVIFFLQYFGTFWSLFQNNSGRTVSDPVKTSLANQYGNNGQGERER
jgi:hypothetical protein